MPSVYRRYLNKIFTNGYSILFGTWSGFLKSSILSLWPGTGRQDIIANMDDLQNFPGKSLANFKIVCCWSVKYFVFILHAIRFNCGPKSFIFKCVLIFFVSKIVKFSRSSGIRDHIPKSAMGFWGLGCLTTGKDTHFWVLQLEAELKIELNEILNF